VSLLAKKGLHVCSHWYEEALSTNFRHLELRIWSRKAVVGNELILPTLLKAA
jgi:hypothetical protein